MSVPRGRKVIALGERDGVAAGAVKACVEAMDMDLEVVFEATECFV
jgi:hypothetical protein